MTKIQDFTSMMKDMMSNMPAMPTMPGMSADTKAVENMFKSQAAFAEKFSAVAIDAAQKSTDLSARWMQDSLNKFADVTRAKGEPTEYAKSVSDFVQTSAESAAEHMAAFAEIAKKVQAETMEIVLTAGKDISEDVTAATKKATAEVTTATRKAASAASAATSA